MRIVSEGGVCAAAELPAAIVTAAKIPRIAWTGGEDGKRLADKVLVNLDAYARVVPLADVFDKNLEY